MLVALRSRRQIAPFVMHRPASVTEAEALRAAPGVNVFMAGGIELIDWLKYGHEVDRVIRLDGIPGLSDIEMTADGLRIGAMATHADIVASPVVRAVLPDLAALWPQVANPRVRFTGTIGGNVMCGNADYDGLPALMALGALAPGQALDGLVTGFVIPEPARLRLFADRSLRPAVSVWLGLQIAGGIVHAVRVAVGTVCVSLPLEGVPVRDLGRVADQVTARLPESVTGYRRRMVGVLTRRILVRAGEGA